MLPDVEMPRAQGECPFDNLGLPFTSRDIEVYPRSRRRRVWNRLEAEVEHWAIWHAEAGLEGVGSVGESRRSEDALPEPAQDPWVQGVDNDVLK